MARSGADGWPRRAWLQAREQRAPGFDGDHDRRVAWSVASPVNPSGLFLAQVLLSGGVNADDVAVGDEKRDHDLEASFELRLLP